MSKTYDTFVVDSHAEPVFGIQQPGPFTLHVHLPSKCAGRTCCIHNPSDHHMRSMPMNWRADIGVMERICAHGVGHPDPDAVAFQVSLGNNNYGTHGCDGCCQKEES